VIVAAGGGGGPGNARAAARVAEPEVATRTRSMITTTTFLTMDDVEVINDISGSQCALSLSLSLDRSALFRGLRYMIRDCFFLLLWDEIKLSSDECDAVVRRNHLVLIKGRKVFLHMLWSVGRAYSETSMVFTCATRWLS